MALNENIRALRIGAGLSQDELAARLGVSRQSVSKWETGSATPELEKLTAMSELFGMTLDELVYGRREPEDEKVSTPPDEWTAGVSRARYITGLVFIVVGGVTALILMLFGASLLLAAICCSPLILCGVACFKARRHLAFWCVASVYAPVFIYLEIGTGVGFYDVEALLAGSGFALRGIIYLALILSGVCLTASGMWIYRNTRIAVRWTHWLILCVLLALIIAPLDVFVFNYLIYRFCVAVKYLLCFAAVVYAYVFAHSLLRRRA